MLTYAVCIFINALLVSPGIVFLIFWIRKSEDKKGEIPIIVVIMICFVIAGMTQWVWPA